MRAAILTFCFSFCLSLTLIACGNKGDLYIPKEQDSQEETQKN